MTSGPSYCAVTPARNESANLRRLAECLRRQTLRPTAWVIVDSGSTDDTLACAHELARDESWIRVSTAPGETAAAPGAPVVRAFHAGLATFGTFPDFIVKLDADVAFDPDHFELLLAAFQRDSRLGIASSVCRELENGRWEPTRVTGTHVRGAVRVYRRECLEALLPLEERMGWDTIDELKANVLGWTTGVVSEVSFLHHRKVGERDTGRGGRWRAQGLAAYYMGYRFGYLVLRALYRARKEPGALAMITAYVGAALRREPVLSDASVRSHLRRQQSLAALPARIREAVGRLT